MNYLELLHLQREPFSNSPDPDAYYGAPLHALYLSRLEIAVHLKRGVNIVLGRVGTGKSTLCRCLLRNLATRPEIETFLLLDAGNANSLTFIAQLYELLSGQPAPDDMTERTGMGLLQTVIYAKALQEEHTLVLLIDEGQKLSAEALEVLRELLNFETNTEKLLQIIIFGQPELEERIAALPNFKDRINEYLHLMPLPEKESIALVRHRLHLAGGQQAERLFSKGALAALHKASKGHPRQLMRLGHQMLLSLIMGNKTQVTAAMVQAQVARDAGSPPPRRWRFVVLLLLAAGLALGAWYALPALTQAWHSTVQPLLHSLGQQGKNLLPASLTPQESTPQSHATQAALPATQAQINNAALPPQAEQSAGVQGAGSVGTGQQPTAQGSMPQAQNPSTAQQGQQPSTSTTQQAPLGQSSGTAHNNAALQGSAQGLAGAAAQRQPNTAGQQPAMQGAKAQQGQTLGQPQQQLPREAQGTQLEQGAQAIQQPASLGVAQVSGIENLRELALIFYGTSAAEKALAQANPQYALGEPQAIALPWLEFALPPTMTKHFLLCFGEYDSPSQAYQARQRLLAFNPRLVARDMGEGLRFYVLSRESFSTAGRAWVWLGKKKTPSGMTARIMPPYAKGEKSLYEFAVR
ncbi:MAG: AAA family ATPase [Desulfovibrionaceae bacterium]|nr:AAA family ATPase [Desulfovibrionaceae bacterium]